MTAQDETLIRLTIGISGLIKRLETLERCIDKLCNCVNDLTVCMEAIPQLDDAEAAAAEAELDGLDGETFDRMLGPAKTH